MKLFGKDILKKKHEANELYDFAQHGLLKEHNFIATSDLDLMAISGDDDISKDYLNKVAENNKKALDGTSKTPKEVYLLESLNDRDFVLNCDRAYVEKQVQSLRRKAKLLPKEEAKKTPWGMSITSGGVINGRLEVESLVERMENRLKYADFKEFYEEFPYTTSKKINELLEHVTNLRARRLEEFIPDLPDEALDVIERYNAQTLALCGKKPVYYMIADKKDFGEMDEKRDPILLAQSPFCLGWQVLGAWDEEMVYLGDL
jgi:hypothetical protein